MPRTRKNAKVVPSITDDFVSTAEAAYMLGVQPITLRQWRRRDLKFSPPDSYKIGGKVWYRKRDLEEFIAASLEKQKRDE